MWREHRHTLQEKRERRRSVRGPQIEALAGAGFTVEKLSDYQYRINGALDLFPTNRRYHHIPTNKRGYYHKPLLIAQAYFRGVT